MRKKLYLFLSLSALPVAAFGSQVVSITSYGAVADTAHAAQNRTALINAFAAAGTEGTVIVPPGSYTVDNSAGPITISGFDGEFQFEGNSRIAFNSGTQSGLVFSGGWGIIMTGLHTYYASTSTISGTAAVSFTGITNLRVNNVIIEGSPGAGISISNSLEPKVVNAVVWSTHGTGISISNSRNAEVVNANVTGSYADGIVFHTDSGITGRDGGLGTNLTVTSGARGIAVSGTSNVVVSDFHVVSASSAGVFCGEDSGSATPSNVAFHGGLIQNPGSEGIVVDNASSCSFADMEIYNAGDHGLTATAPQGVVAVDGVHVLGTNSSDGFNFTNVAQVKVSASSAERIAGYGLFVDTATRAQVSGFTADDVSTSSSLHRAFWVQNTTTMVATDLTIVDDQSSATGYVVGSSGIQKGNMQNISSAINNGALSVQNASTVKASQIY